MYPIKEKNDLTLSTPVVPPNRKELDANSFLREAHQLMYMAKRDFWTEEHLIGQVLQLTDQNPNLVETMDFPRTAEDIKNQLLIPAKMKQNTEHLEFNISEKRLIHFDDKGKEVESWPARTGNLSGKVSMEKNRGPLPPGEYLLGGKPRPKDDKAFCDQERDCWSQTLDANFETERELLAIHPDGGDAGTAGCIGNTDEVSESLKDFLNERDTKLPFPVIVKP